MSTPMYNNNIITHKTLLFYIHILRRLLMGYYRCAVYTYIYIIHTHNTYRYLLYIYLFYIILSYVKFKRERRINYTEYVID